MKLRNINTIAASALALTFLAGCASDNAHSDDMEMKDADHTEMKMAADDHGAMKMGADEHGEDAVYGEAGMVGMVNKTISISIEDNAYSVPSFNVKEGETVRIIVKNMDDFEHELVIGTKESMAEHRLEMEAMMDKGMEMEEHASPNVLELGDMASGELIWKFTKAGMFEFACNIPGHYEAGMHGMIMVSDGHG